MASAQVDVPLWKSPLTLAKRCPPPPSSMLWRCVGGLLWQKTALVTASLLCFDDENAQRVQQPELKSDLLDIIVQFLDDPIPGFDECVAKLEQRATGCLLSLYSPAPVLCMSSNAVANCRAAQEVEWWTPRSPSKHPPRLPHQLCTSVIGIS